MSKNNDNNSNNSKLGCVADALSANELYDLQKQLKSLWDQGIASEIRFWDAFFTTKGLQWAATYGRRFDPDLPLQPRPSALLPKEEFVYILDVGAGPLTWLGKKCAGKNINITAVDALAEMYDQLLLKHQVVPLVRTLKLDAEELAAKISSNTFDLVFARNCIDHSYNPEKAIIQMITVVKTDRYVLLEHIPNEAEKEGYSGIHQWNFSVSSEGDFLIGSKYLPMINMTQKYSSYGEFTCEIVNENGTDWLVTRIRKR